jgi:hypothetical protein
MSFIRNSCLRKLRHTNYLTALSHAACLEDDGRLVVYPCSLCRGLHVEHLRQRSCSLLDPAIAALDGEQLQKLIRRAQQRVRCAVADLGRRVEPTQEDISRAQQRICDRQRHLSLLQSALVDLIRSIEDDGGVLPTQDRTFDDPLAETA